MMIRRVVGGAGIRAVVRPAPAHRRPRIPIRPSSGSRLTAEIRRAPQEASHEPNAPTPPAPQAPTPARPPTIDPMIPIIPMTPMIFPDRL